MTTIQGDGFTVNVVKSARRKTLAIKVSANAVSIHIPVTLPIAEAQRFINKKTSWITKKLHQQSYQQPITREFTEGEILFFLGENYSLQLQQQNIKPAVTKSSQHIKICGRLNRLSTATIRATLISWYKQQATNYLISRTTFFSQKMALNPTSIRVKTYKARWGSCNIRGDIQFNWQLIQAPIDVIDYVIIHELCHLTHHNHSSQFWQLVEYFCIHFKVHRQWLKDHGHRLIL